MVSNEFKARWRTFASGAAITALAFTFVGSVLDKNPVMTLLIAVFGFLAANVAYFLANTANPPET